MLRRIFHAQPESARLVVLLVACIGLLSGCTSSIGDECESDGDCPSGSLCDTTVANGYCTIPDCRTGDCPEEAGCVKFDRQTRFCMELCEGDDDCREDHVCRQDFNFEGEPVGYCFVPERTPDESGN